MQSRSAGHESDALEHGVGTAAVGAILNEARDVDLVGVHGDGTEALCHLQALRHRVDGVDRRRLVAPRPEDRHEADRSAADDGDHVSFFDPCLARAVVPGGEDVADEQGLLIAHRVIDAVQHEIGVRDTHVLRLSAGDVAEERAVSEDTLVGAPAEQPPIAVPARSARDGERADDAIAFSEATHAAIDGFDHADELVPEDAARRHPGNASMHHMQVAAADRGRGDTHQGVTGLGDARLRHVGELDRVEILEDQCPHRQPPLRGAISALLPRRRDAG